MANKALSKRQKLTIRVEPSQRPLKARNALAPSARQRVAGGQQKDASAQQQAQQHLLKKLLGGKDEDE